MKLKALKKISSITELFRLTANEPRYAALAVCAARNLGGSINQGDLRGARDWLNINAMETAERGVVNEINFCIPLIK